MNKIAWKRIFNVILYTDSGKSITFGTQCSINQSYDLKLHRVIREQHNDLHVCATGTKYLSPLKDEFVVSVYNLDYENISTLIEEGYNNIRIEVGYESLNNGIPTKIFDGGVLYISNDRSNLSQNITYIICTSKMIARYNRTKLNLTINGGINMFAALKFLGSKVGATNIYISPDLKNKVVQNSTVIDGTLATSLSMLVDSKNEYSNALIAATSDSSVGANDSSNSATFNILSLYKIKSDT